MALVDQIYLDTLSYKSIFKCAYRDDAIGCCLVILGYFYSYQFSIPFKSFSY